MLHGICQKLRFRQNREHRVRGIKMSEKKTRFGSTHFWVLVVGSVALLAWLHLKTPWRCGFGSDRPIPKMLDEATAHTLIELQSVGAGVWAMWWQAELANRFIWPLVIYAVFVILVFAHYFLKQNKDEGSPNQMPGHVP